MFFCDFLVVRDRGIEIQNTRRTYLLAFQECGWSDLYIIISGSEKIRPVGSVCFIPSYGRMGNSTRGNYYEESPRRRYSTVLIL